MNKSSEEITTLNLQDNKEVLAQEQDNNNKKKKKKNINNNLKPILTTDGFYKIGQGNDKFILIISIKATYNLSKLITDISNQN